MSPQSKSFIILFCIALVGTFIATNMYLNMAINSDEYSYYSGDSRIISYSPPSKKSLNPISIDTAEAAEPEIPVNTSDWKTYTSNEFKLKFKYPGDWQIKQGKDVRGFNVLEIDPGKKFYTIKIYIHLNEFYAIDGLPFVQETIANAPAINVRDLLYGIKTPSLGYTFDIGLSLSLKPNFKALVHSVEFLP